eukprot:scaffold463_cov103-Isochrysis_galbana.AAC.4
MVPRLCISFLLQCPPMHRSRQAQVEFRAARGRRARPRQHTWTASSGPAGRQGTQEGLDLLARRGNPLVDRLLLLRIAVAGERLGTQTGHTPVTRAGASSPLLPLRTGMRERMSAPLEGAPPGTMRGRRAAGTVQQA